MTVPIEAPANAEIARWEAVFYDATPTFKEPTTTDLTSDEWQTTPLGQAITLYNNREVIPEVAKVIKTSYDRNANGEFSGSLLYDGIVVWECGHDHAKPEYNRRDMFYADMVWVASAAHCAMVAQSEFIDGLYTRTQQSRTDHPFMEVTGTAGRFARPTRDTGDRRQDQFRILLDVKATETEDYRLRIWNGGPRLLYVFGRYREMTESSVVGYINLDDPSDTSGRPDPSLFPSPLHYRRWLKIAAWGYENTWGDSFRRKVFAPNFLTVKTIQEENLDPKVPKRAADYFRVNNKHTESKHKTSGKSLEMSKEESDPMIQTGLWLRTNRDGRKRSYTVMNGDTEVTEPILNRGEAIKKLERIEATSNVQLFSNK